MDFDLRTDNQAITWLKTNQHLNKMYVRWLEEIEDCRFTNVTHLPGARNPTDPLLRSCFADGDGPAASTGDPDSESQHGLFSRLGRDASAPAAGGSRPSAQGGRSNDVPLRRHPPTFGGGGREPLYTAQGRGRAIPPVY